MQVFVKPTSSYHSKVKHREARMKVRLNGQIVYLFEREGSGGYMFASNIPLKDGTILVNELAGQAYDLSHYLWIREEDCMLMDMNTNASAVALLRR